MSNSRTDPGPTAAVCRSCGGPMLPVVFGFPSHEMFEAAERGEIILGGCCLPIEGEPRRSCACGELVEQAVEFD